VASPRPIAPAVLEPPRPATSPVRSNPPGAPDGGAQTRGRNEGPSERNRSDRDWRDRGDGDGGRYDRGRRGKDEGPDHSNGIVIHPIVIHESRVGPVRLSPATVIGRPVVIGGPTIDPRYGRVVTTRTPDVVYVAQPVYDVPGYVDVGGDVVVDYGTNVVAQYDDATLSALPMNEPPPLASLDASYTFNVWYAVSDAIVAGYPFPYPEAFATTYDKAALAAGEVLSPQALQAIERGAPLVPYKEGTFGGLLFQIEPASAAVYVNDLYVGQLEDYMPGGAPLPLPVGTHKVEVRVNGYRTETFEVVVTLGQVTPLAGQLVPLP
jgi:hypothetical protein